jgi:MFS superfamily sulfate permease-like transporter
MSWACVTVLFQCSTLVVVLPIVLVAGIIDGIIVGIMAALGKL